MTPRHQINEGHLTHFRSWVIIAYVSSYPAAHPVALKLLQMGWVYDINFRPSLPIIRDRGYLKLLRAALPPSGAIDDACSVVIGILEKRIAGAD